MKLQDRVILITGASQGLGAEAARACAEAGATVVLVGRSQKKLEKVYDAIVSAGCPEPFAVVFDLLATEEQEYERLAKAVAEATGGRLNGIIHSAAYFYALSPLEFQTVAEWVNQYRINTVGLRNARRLARLTKDTQSRRCGLCFPRSSSIRTRGQVRLIRAARCGTRRDGFSCAAGN